MTTLKYPPVGISGRKRAGKNTVAEAMVDVAARRGVPARVSAFADPLRAVLLATDPIIAPIGVHNPAGALRLSDLFALGDTWETIKEHAQFGHEVRRLLQNLGTEGIRAIDPNFWIYAARDDILAHPYHLTVVPDVRFANEAALVHDLRGIHVHVVRPHADGEDDTHVTETNSAELGRYASHHIVNDRDTGHVRAEATRIANEYIDSLTN